MSGISPVLKTTPTDRRTGKTRDAILRAFSNLLLAKGYDDLTVGEIADAANVGRSTFYEHFSTKRVLLCTSVAGPFSRLAQVVNQPGDGASVSLEELGLLLQHFRENQHVVRSLLSSSARGALTQTLADLIVVRLQQKCVGGGALSLPIELVALQIAEVQLTLVLNGMAMVPALSLQLIAKALVQSSNVLSGVYSEDTSNTLVSNAGLVSAQST